MPVTEAAAAIAASCDLCGLACGSHPYKQKIGECDHSFCCMGCMNVNLILSESAGPEKHFRETELFKRCLEMGIISRPDEQTEVPTEAPDAGIAVEELLLHVRGMWCTSCAWLIEYALKKMPGVISVEASFASDLAKVKYQPQLVPPSKIPERIRGLGYEAQDFREGLDIEDKEKRDLLLRLGIAAFLWMNVMYLSMTLYVSFFENIADSIRQYIPFVIWTLATPVVFYCGYPIHRLAWFGLKNRTIRAEALLSMGVLAAYFYSIVQAFRADSHIYFDTGCVIITLVLTGKLFERNAKHRATRWITLLHRLMPNKVRLLSQGQERFTSIEALQAGQEFLVKAGEQIPADGLVAEGECYCDESLLTGESQPLRKAPGCAVVAGSVSLNGVLKIQALRTAEESTLSRILARVEYALGQRSPIERAVDRVARIFVPVVMTVAIVTFATLWLVAGASVATALMRAITVLVIACPCALGLATPLAVTAAMGSASRSGILFRDSRALETVRQVDAVILDKTGTITEASFTVLALTICREGSERPDSGTDVAVSDAISQVASLEQYSEHPLGRAVVTYARAEGVRLAETSSVEVFKGQGIVGEVKGERVFVGNRRLVEQHSVTLDPQAAAEARQWEMEGKTVTFFGWAGEVRGLIAFGDRIRDEARSLVAELKKKGRLVYLVSGDSPATTRWVAGEIGVDHYESDVLPEGKAEVVRQLQAQGLTVAMIGDGVNDAPALAQADLGIAMGSGADLAMKAAAVVLMKSSLGQIPEIFTLSAKTIQIVRQNLFWAFFYNGLGIGMAIAGLLNPILAAGAMLLSSVSVIANSMRLVRQ